MKEYILSYDSNELKERYIYHSFEYRNYPIIKAYPFIYKRGSISLNTQYFKDLVAFSRRFTKSSLLLSIFSEDNNITLNKKGIFLENNTITIKSNKSFSFISYNSFFKIRKTLEKYHDQFMMHMTFKHYINMFDNIYVMPSSHIKLNRFENIHGKTDSVTNYYENFLIQDLIRYKELNRYENNMSSRDMFFNVFNDICNFKLNNYNLYLFENINSKVKDYIINIVENYFTEKINNDNLKLFDGNELFSVQDKLINLYENIYVQQNINIINLFENNFLNKNDNKDLYFYNSIDGGSGKKHKDIKLFTYDSFRNITNKDLSLLYSKAITPHELILNIYNNYYTKKQISSDIKLFSDTEYMLSMNEILLNIFNYYSFKLNEINAEIFDTNSFLEKDKHKLFISEGSIIDKSKYTHLFHVFGYDLVTKGEIDSFYTKENVFFSKVYKYGYSFNNIDNAKLNKHLYIIKQIKSLSKDFNRHLYNLKTGDHLVKKQRDIYLNKENNIIAKSAILFRIINSGDISNRTKYDISIYNTFNGYSKINKDLYLYKNNTDAYICKTSRNINRYNYIESIFKIPYDIARKEYTEHIHKVSKDISLQLYNIFLKQSYKYILTNDENVNLLKSFIPTSIEEHNINNIIKNLILTNLYSNEQYGIISSIKYDKAVFTDDLINFLYKKRKETGYVFSFELTGSKISSNVFDLDGLLCDSLGKNTVYNDFINTSIIKQQLQTRYINDDLFINKYYKRAFDNVFYNVTKKYFTAFEYNREIINKTIKNTNAEDNFAYVIKKETLTNVFNLEFFNYTKFAFVSNEDTIFKLPKYVVENNIINIDLYKNVFEYSDSFGERENLVHDMHSNDFIKNNNNQKYAFIKDAENILRKNLFPAFYTDPTYLNKDFITDYLPEFSALKKIMAEVNIPTDDIVDWAWVYEEEDPFNDPFKIDELLLPENDTIYEDFENIIFNREKCVPRSPLKIIDKHTFIAKFPNHYPIKDENGENAYKDIAIEYLDVRTSIMRRVFIGYYKLWQDNIFEFSRMTIPQSAKKMLDYLYVWITLNFNEEDILEALRTFRLIRWYLERGIIECSEYKITYEPDDLTSGRLSRSSDLQIRNDMFEKIDDEPINNTMYIDTQNHVIRNNPNMLSQDAYITFIIENEKDTLISFDINSATPIEIWLNKGTEYEELLDRITLPTTGKMVYNIPYTGEINYFKILRCLTDNNDNYFFIGNIVVKGMGHTGELNIEYEPKIQGNKVLNYVSQKVLAYTNLYEDNNELFNELVKGNVHIAEVYDKLVEYWNLHHENKDKGKRLTIKRT